MMLSRNFTLAEMIASDAARALDDDNRPTADHLANMRLLAFGMEQVRSVLGSRPVTIESAYRNARVNEAVGGVAKSAHALGLAADFTVPGMAALDVAQALERSKLVWDQLILEISRGVCHISFAPALRREVLTQAGGPGSVVRAGLPKVTVKPASNAK